MSYAQRKEISGNRTLSIILVLLIQFGLGYAIVTGLAYNVIKKASTDLKTFDVEEKPPPPEPPPPPPKDMPKVPPPPMTPPPLVRVNTTPPPIQVVESPVIPPVAPPVMAPPKPPPPPAPAPRQTEPKSLVGSLQGLITSEDYPPSALDNNEQGTVSVSLTVGPSGRVTGCSPSGGPSSLQQATCRLLTSRARFSPAQDGSGNPVTSSTSARITWRIAE